MLDPIVAHLVEQAMEFGGVIVVVGCAAVVTIVRSKGRGRAGLAGGDIARRLDEMAMQLNNIESAVDASAVEIERIAEGQRFTTRLLAERPSPDSSPMPGARPYGKTTPRSPD